MFINESFQHWLVTGRTTGHKNSTSITPSWNYVLSLHSSPSWSSHCSLWEGHCEVTILILKRCECKMFLSVPRLCCGPECMEMESPANPGSHGRMGQSRANWLTQGHLEGCTLNWRVSVSDMWIHEAIIGMTNHADSLLVYSPCNTLRTACLSVCV